MDHLQTRLVSPERRPHIVARQCRWWRGFAFVLITLVTWVPVQAAVLPCPTGDVACLIAAINTANGNGEDDTIQLEAGIYTFTTVDNETDGANGLPSITSALTIQGTGADSTILERATDASPFRLLRVSAEGVLHLEGLTVRGGHAVNSGSEPPFPPFAFEGGGIPNFGAVWLTHSRLSDNVAGGGGGLLSADGTVEITETSVLDNGADHPGGGFWNCGGTATIARSTFVGNGADFGIILNGFIESGPCDGTLGGTMTIVHTTIADNEANDVAGLFNDGTMLVLNSAIVRNVAETFEIGGILNGGTLTLINTTVAANRAPEIGGISNSGTLTLINSTVADNESFDRGVVGGLENSPSSTAVLSNTILARNTTDEGVPDCLGPVTSQGHNLIGDPTGCTITLHPSDLTGAPALSTLVDDGIPGHAHLPLLIGSPAINAGNPEVCAQDPRLATDQLGQPRVGICDIGSIEFPEASVPSCQGGRSHIRGQVITTEESEGLSEVVLTLDGPGACQEMVATGEIGFYVFPHLKEGPYTVTPSAPTCTFDPPSRIVTLEEGGRARLNFAAICL